MCHKFLLYEKFNKRRSSGAAGPTGSLYHLN